MVVNRTKLLQQAAAELAAPPAAVSHEQVLAHLLEQVEPVDFRALAGLTDERNKLQTAHCVVIVVQEVLALADRNSWGLCRRQGFLYSYNGAFWKKLDDPTMRSFLRKAAERLGMPPINARFVNFSELLYKQFLELATLRWSS